MTRRNRWIPTAAVAGHALLVLTVDVAAGNARDELVRLTS